MRASVLTFLFIISEYSIISGGDGQCSIAPNVSNAEKKVVSGEIQKFRMACKNGYRRQAGTSDLFKCKNNTWINKPPLVCMDLTTIYNYHSTVTLSLLNTTPEMDHTTRQPDEYTSSVSGKFVTTTTQTAFTTPWTSSQTSQRTTATDKETVAQFKLSEDEKKGITAGIIILFAGFTATVAFILFRRRSRLHGASGHSIDMNTDNSGSDRPLMNTQTAVLEQLSSELH